MRMEARFGEGSPLLHDRRNTSPDIETVVAAEGFSADSPTKRAKSIGGGASMGMGKAQSQGRVVRSDRMISGAHCLHGALHACVLQHAGSRALGS